MSRLHRFLSAVFAWGLCALPCLGNGPAIQSLTNAPPLGKGEPTPFLLFDASVAPTSAVPLKAWKKAGNRATNVVVAGTWSSWTGRHAMVQMEGDLWQLDTRTLGARLGQHEFKFIVNGTWEEGENRVLPINLDGAIEQLPRSVLQAVVEDFDMIRVFFRKRLPEGAQPTASLEPPVPILWTEVVTEMEDARLSGYVFNRGIVTFIFDPASYGLPPLPKTACVAVAGNFTGWDASGGYNGKWRLAPSASEGLWELSAQLDGMRLPQGEKDLLFKFVIDGRRWLPPPMRAPNQVLDEGGVANLRVDLARAGGAEIRVHTAEPLDVRRNYTLRIDGAGPRPLGIQTTPGAVLDRIVSKKPLGVTFDRERGTTTYRLFAPRATDVWLCFFKRAEAMAWTPEFKRFRPDVEYRMARDASDGTWSLTMNGLDAGAYYGFRVAGPEGNGESFDPYHVIGDPYARAVATANGLSIAVDPLATNQWFGGWTDQSWKTPEPQDLVVYECHVRGQTIHPSAEGIPRAQRGTYEGLRKSIGTDIGIGHVKALGANAVELLPVAEFSESEDSYSWGYSTAYFFAPESSYASNPTNGAAYYEFKQLVNDLHNAGLAVILDVVYNHVGGPNVFALAEKKGYFRLLPDLSFSNHSGCGNDVRTEFPMMRRLIVDNILYFMREFHVDGFRFDLAELIDMYTMMEIIEEARQVNPDVILVSEPWSPGRGENKSLLKGTGWSAWNNDFRYAAKDFVRGGGDRDWLRGAIFGSVHSWAQNPLQPVNYLESHDDMAFADEISSAPNHDGRKLEAGDVALNRLAATILFTSLGRTMLYEGQEFLRSKWGINNTYNRGDAVNAIKWTDRERPLAAKALDYYSGLVHLRMSPEGAAFRVASRPPSSYYQWLLPSNRHLLGYVVNVPELHAGRGFIVLLNSDTTPQTFSLTFPGESGWKLIGNGSRIDLGGVPNVAAAPASRPPTWAAGEKGQLLVPPKASLILMNGF